MTRTVPNRQPRRAPKPTGAVTQIRHAGQWQNRRHATRIVEIPATLYAAAGSRTRTEGATPTPSRAPAFWRTTTG